MEKLAPIFDEVQKSLVSHNACAKRLQSLLLKESSSKNENDIMKIILEVLMDSILNIVKKEPSVERILTFLVDFLASTSIDDKNFNRAINHLLARTLSSEKNVRIRSCQILSEIISKMSSDTEITDDLWQLIISTLLPRLKDKNATVRMWALKALSSFQNQEDLDDPVTMEIIRIISTDNASTVRSVAVEVIALTTKTLPVIVERVRDISSEVRLNVISRISQSVLIRQLSAASRVTVIRHSLNDREKSVKDAAIMLVSKWINQLENRIPKLLSLLNLQLFEEEAERLGWVILEAIDSKIITDKAIVQGVLEQRPNWSGSFEYLNASEIFWVRIRCDYARSKPQSQFSCDIIENILPDVVVLCDLLVDARIASLNNNIHQQLTMKYLLQIGSFVESTDTSGREKLRTFCEKALQDLLFSEHLVDTLMDAWARTVDEDVVIQKSNDMSSNLISKYYTETSINIDESNHDALLAAMRYLQIMAWTMSRTITSKAGSDSNVEEFKSSIPVIQFCLQLPLVQLRNQSVTCMGLLGMMSESLCIDNKEILIHVVSNDLEDSSIRCYAMKSLVDYAMVYPNLFSGNTQLVNILIRLQDNDSDIEIASLAAESSIKLLFGGVLSDTRLFAILLRVFFFPEISFIDGADENDESKSKLLQSLSIFFQTVFLIDSNLLNIALNAIPDLMSDISMILRGSLTFDASDIGLDKVVNKILSLSDKIDKTSSSLTATKFNFRAAFCSCLSREILKFGNSKVDKALAKDYLKCLCSISPSSWMTVEQKTQVMDVIRALSAVAMRLDKPTQNNLDKFMKACEAVEEAQESNIVKGNSVSASELTSDFYSMAPGLKDFVDSSTMDDSIIGTVNSKPKRKATRTRRIDEEEEDDDSSLGDEDVVAMPSRSRLPSRASKAVAMSKLSTVVSDDDEDSENVINC